MSNLTIGRERGDTAVRSATDLYRAIWRWHFYAGLLVLPFLLVLAVTGLIMLYGNSVETFLGPRYTIAVGGERASFAAQAAAAQNAVPESVVKMLVVPSTPDSANLVVVTAGGQDHVISVDPHGPAVIGSVIKDDTWFYWANKIHGTLLIGNVGDWIQEIAAGLGIVLVLTGIYLWWPRNGRGLRAALVPNLAARGRTLWKELHQATGFFLAIVLVFFFVSGLAWTGVWGKKIVQAWSTFPAEKWDNVPLSDATHADMNHGALKEVPWALEQTSMPASGSMAGMDGLPAGTPVNLDSVAALARRIGFSEQFRINAPADKKGVYTISADSMDGDTTNPTGDRTVHVDQYTGKILTEVRFADYSPAGKAMAVGIALHQGNLGLWNTALNLVFCLAVIFMTVSGAVMWWKRRPAGRIGVPAYPRNYRAPAMILVIAAAVCVLFPLTGLAVIAFGLIDLLLPKRFKEIGMVQR
jgi:uncharacterized iron-regulated membrane protein